VDFEDFRFYRLEPVDLYYVGGFGVMGWVSVSDYASAAPDPLAGAAAGILEHMNADHVDAMILLARVQAQLEATEAAMTSVDRLGFTLRVKTAAGMKGARINFVQEARSAQEVRKELVEMVQCARAIG
jgi:putative heme iron utilization protein